MFHGTFEVVGLYQGPQSGSYEGRQYTNHVVLTMGAQFKFSKWPMGAKPPVAGQPVRVVGNLTSDRKGVTLDPLAVELHEIKPSSK